MRRFVDLKADLAEVMSFLDQKGLKYKYDKKKQEVKLRKFSILISATSEFRPKGQIAKSFEDNEAIDAESNRVFTELKKRFGEPQKRKVHRRVRPD